MLAIIFYLFRKFEENKKAAYKFFQLATGLFKFRIVFNILTCDFYKGIFQRNTSRTAETIVLFKEIFLLRQHTPETTNTVALNFAICVIGQVKNSASFETQSKG
jgi:hypothetical protein